MDPIDTVRLEMIVYTNFWVLVCVSFWFISSWMYLQAGVGGVTSYLSRFWWWEKNGEDVFLKLYLREFFKEPL